MALSRMSSREKTIIAVLGVIIILALVGIGILAARLLGDGDQEDTQPIAVASATSSSEAEATVTARAGGTGEEMTPVAPPELDEGQDVPPPVAGTDPVAVVQAESPGPLLPAMITNQTLYPNHRYRIEIATADGSQLAIQGSWSQAATSSSGQPAAPQIEFFEGVTPHNIPITPPVADPEVWGCSVSAALKEPLGQTTNLIITIWDVTGVQ
jgi:hypothetical protein